MLIYTKSIDTLIKRAVPKNTAGVLPINLIIEGLLLDPKLSNPPRDAFIIASRDLRVPKIRESFTNAVANKHPDCKVILIDQDSRPLYENNVPAGISKVLSKPKHVDLSNAITEIMSNEAISSVPEIGETLVDIPDTEFSEFDNPITFPTGEDKEEDNFEPIVQEEPLDIKSFEEDIQPVAEPDGELDIITRIKSAGKIADISNLTEELRAADIIKKMVNESPTFAGIEGRLDALLKAIQVISEDPAIKTKSEKLSAIETHVAEKMERLTRSSTLIEQQVDEIIRLICSKAGEVVHERLAEIDESLEKIRQVKMFSPDHNARLSGLMEDRTNLMLELKTMEFEIKNTFIHTDKFLVDTIATVAGRATNPTGDKLTDELIMARGVVPVPEGILDVIVEMHKELAPLVTEEMKSLNMMVAKTYAYLNKVIELDRETIAQQEGLIRYYKANKIEDTVIAKTLLKKTMRVYIGQEGSGRTIIPYLISIFKSRQNANVLLLDMTGQGKYENYDIRTIDLYEYMEKLPQHEFVVVSGTVVDDVATAQRIVNTLLKSADYYRVINVVLRPDQRELFETISDDVLSVNYITKVDTLNLNWMKDFIKETSVDNVAKRVILNRCDIAIRKIISKLDLDDSIDFQACVVPTVPVINEAELNHFNPYNVSKIVVLMEEVLRNA